ncbi:MAG: LysM peptidoglycan-binding domain-containing protein, partial [Propionibacteriaceae bacterium]|nr:LysM peptidoglycan-binding domain-containing protein [Propionibacteriaceae bacterium]
MMRQIRGGLAVAALVLVVLGAPVLLVQAGRYFGPSRIPGWSEIWAGLTSPDDGTIVAGLLLIAGWLAWAYLTVAVGLELVARVRRRPLPRARFWNPGQAVARVLVASAAGLFVVAGPALTTLADTSPPAVVTTTTNTDTPLLRLGAPAPAPPLVPTANPALTSGPAEFRGAPSPTGYTEHTVVRGDTLSDIAQAQLADGNRWPELFELTRGLDQPTGWPITNPDEIDIGQIVRVPVADLTPSDPQAPAPAADPPIADPADPAPTPPAADPQTPTPSPADPPAADPTAPPTAPSSGISGTGGATPTPAPTAPSSTAPSSTAPSSTAPGSATPSAGASSAGAGPVAAPAPPSSSAPSSSAPSSPGASPTAPTPTPTPTVPTAGTPSATPTPTTAGADSTASADADVADPAEDDGLDDAALPLRTLGGVSSILAAGVLAMVGRHRARQVWRLRPGHRLPLPEGADGVVTARLRMIENPDLVRAADGALRALVQGCAEENLDLPELRAARLTEANLQLFLTRPTRLPEPWTPTVDPAVWTCALNQFGPPLPSEGAVDELAETDDDAVPAPYPALVCIGQDAEEAHLLLDMEEVGVLGLTGPSDLTHEAMSAIAVELATSVWADDITVTAVGAGSDFDRHFQTGCLRHVDDLAPLLEPLAERADHDRAALLAANLRPAGGDGPAPQSGGLAALHRARVRGLAGDTWYPEILVLSGATRPGDRAQLGHTVAGQPRVAIACVTTEPEMMGEYRVEFDNTGRAVLQPFGLPLVPQRLNDDVLASLVHLADQAQAEPELSDLDEEARWSELVDALENVDPTLVGSPTSAGPAPAGVPTPVGLPVSAATPTPVGPRTPTGPLASVPIPYPTVAPNGAWDPPAAPTVPYVRVLGPVDVVGARGVAEPTKVRRMTEILAFLVLHPGAAGETLDEAIWPDRPSTDNTSTRYTATSKLRKWLGEDDEGRPFLEPGRLECSGVGSDWADWNRLIGPGGPARASTENLVEALALVRGVPFSGSIRRGYRWADLWQHTMLAAVTDAAWELARRQCRASRFRDADRAIDLALMLSPGEERFWRLRIMAHYAVSNRTALQSTIDGLYRMADSLGCDLEPETTKLLAELGRTPLLNPRLKRAQTT